MVIAIENVKRELFGEISNLKKELAEFKKIKEMKDVGVQPRLLLFDTRNFRKELAGNPIKISKFTFLFIAYLCGRHAEPSESNKRHDRKFEKGNKR